MGGGRAIQSGENKGKKREHACVFVSAGETKGQPKGNRGHFRND